MYHVEGAADDEFDGYNAVYNDDSENYVNFLHLVQTTYDLYTGQ